MKKLAILIIVTMMLANQARAEVFFDSSKQIGCGTITSVRNVDQEPMLSDDSMAYRLEYRPVKDRTESLGTLALFTENSLSGAVAAVAGSIIYDAVANSKSDVATLNPAERLGKKMHAVRIALDDGRVMNLPLIEAKKPFLFGHGYEVGRRVFVAYNQLYRNIQIEYPQSSQPPVKGESSYEKTCDFRADKDLADLIVKNSEFIVDESKIVE